MSFRKEIVLAAFAILTVADQAYSGVGSSGGGPSVNCEFAAGQPLRSYSYDLFEGRARYGFTIPESDNGESVDEFARKAISKLKAFDYGIGLDVESRYIAIAASLQFLPTGVLMQAPNDLGEGQAAIYPAACTLSYAAYFESSGKIRVSKSVYDSLVTNRDRAALILHESIYVLARDKTNQKDSKSTRLVNAFLFSDEKVATGEVQDALSTLVSFGQLTPILRLGPNDSIELQTTCKVLTSRDSLNWSGDFQFSGADLQVLGGISFGSLIPTEDLNTRSEYVTIPLGTQFMKVTALRGARGHCLGQPLNILVNGNIIAQISADGGVASSRTILRVYR